MKKLMLLMIGLGIFVISCKKKEIQTGNSMNDSTMVSDTVTDTMTTGTPMDTTTSVRDSSNMNQTTGTTTNRTTPSGTRTDSAR